MKRDVVVLSVPFGLGAGVSGSERGPEAIAEAGILERLRKHGHRVQHRIVEDTPGRRTDAPCYRPPGAIGLAEKMKHFDEVLSINRLLAKETAGVARSGRFPLMLGGDHSLAMGTIAGLTQRYGKLGVIWFDAHADLNTEATSPSGNMHGIPLAVALGRSRLKPADVCAGACPLRPDNVALVAARDIDPGEMELIREANIRLFTMKDIRERGIERVMLEALRIAGSGTNGVHLSFDIDSVDPSEAAGTGTPVAGGISAKQAMDAFGVLRRSGKLTSMDAVEVNPSLDRAPGRTAWLAAKLVSSLFYSF